MGTFIEDTRNDRGRPPAVISASVNVEPALAFNKRFSVLLSVSYMGRLEHWVHPDPTRFRDVSFNSSIVKVAIGVRYRLTWTRVLPYISAGAGAGAVLIETSYGPSTYGTSRRGGGVVFGAIGMEIYPKDNKVAITIEARPGLWIGQPLITDVPGDGGFPYGVSMGPFEGTMEIHFGVAFRT